jgi:hypothetical protein
MKLDKEQVELINSFLVKNEVVFDDIRYEIIDHIACDVEENYAEIPFPDAIKLVLKKWERQVQMSNSFWVSSWSNFPRVITNKLKQLSIPQVIVISLIIMSSLVTNLYFPTIIDNFKVYENVFKIVYVLWFICMSVFGIKIFLTKAYTTYKYMFKRNFFMVYLFTILLFFGYMNGIIMLTYLWINLSFTTFFIQNYRAHFKFLKRI